MQPEERKVGGSFQLGVVAVTVGVPLGFLLEVSLKSFTQVHACLIGQSRQNPQDVGHFVSKVFSDIRGFFALVTISARHDPGQFAHLFGKDGHVGEFAEVSDTNGGDPFVHGGLDLSQ